MCNSSSFGLVVKKDFPSCRHYFRVVGQDGFRQLQLRTAPHPTSLCQARHCGFLALTSFQVFEYKLRIDIFLPFTPIRNHKYLFTQTPFNQQTLYLHTLSSFTTESTPFTMAT